MTGVLGVNDEGEGEMDLASLCVLVVVDTLGFEVSFCGAGLAVEAIDVENSCFLVVVGNVENTCFLVVVDDVEDSNFFVVVDDVEDPNFFVVVDDAANSNFCVVL